MARFTKKVERCIRDVKKTEAAKAGRVNPFAVCQAAVKGGSHMASHRKSSGHQSGHTPVEKVRIGSSAHAVRKTIPSPVATKAMVKGPTADDMLVQSVKPGPSHPEMGSLSSTMPSKGHKLESVEMPRGMNAKGVRTRVVSVGDAQFVNV